MRYKIIKGGKLIPEIFRELKKTNLVNTSYPGKTVSNIIDKEGRGIVYELTKSGEYLTIVGDKRRSLIRKFMEKINKNKIELEKIW